MPHQTTGLPRGKRYSAGMREEVQCHRAGSPDPIPTESGRCRISPGHPPHLSRADTYLGTVVRRAESPGMYITYFVQSLILLNVGISISLGNLFLTLSSLGAFSLTLIPYILTRNLNIRIPWTLNLLIALSIYLHVAGHVGEYYVLFAPYYDKIAHLVSSVTIAAIGFIGIILVDHLCRMRLPRAAIVFFVVLFTITMGTAWEMYEFILDQAFGMTLQHGNYDTMSDLIVDVIGAFIVAALGDAYLRRVPKRAIVERFINLPPEKQGTLLSVDESDTPFLAHEG